MTPKDISLFLEAEPGWEARLHYAGGLAARWQAHLAATFVPEALELDIHGSYARGGALTHMLQSHSARMQAAEAEMHAALEAMKAELGLDTSWSRADHEWGDGLMLRARYSDLALIGPGERGSKPRTLLSFAQDSIFASGRPVLLLPEDWPAERLPRHIVIGWNGSSESARAVANAMAFLRLADRVDVVLVSGAGVHTREGFDPGVALQTHLARHGVPADLHVVEHHQAGPTILDFTAQAGGDLIVMGAYGHSKFAETIFGGATRFLLTHADVPTLLSL